MLKEAEVTKELKLVVSVACSIAFVFFLYNLVESIRCDDGHSTDPRKKKKVEGENLLPQLELLEDKDLDEKDLVVLETLLKYSTFTEGQKQITSLGYLPKVCNLLNHSDTEVKHIAALIISNLLLNEESYVILIECIPRLMLVLETSSIELSSVEFFIATLRILTKLTTLIESHEKVIPYLHVLYHILQECDVVHVKLQVFKILVNITTNKKICENMLEFDAQILRCMETFICSNDCDEIFLLKALSCCANVLDSLQRRWQYGGTDIAAPEFTNDEFDDHLLRLALHHNGDIRFQARRCVSALRTPVTPTSSAHSLDQLDMLDVLQL